MEAVKENRLSSMSCEDTLLTAYCCLCRVNVFVTTHASASLAAQWVAPVLEMFVLAAHLSL